MTERRITDDPHKFNSIKMKDHSVSDPPRLRTSCSTSELKPSPKFEPRKINPTESAAEILFDKYKHQKNDEVILNKKTLNFTEGEGVIPVTKKKDDFSKIRKCEISLSNSSKFKVQFEFITLNNDGRPNFELLIDPKKGKLKKNGLITITLTLRVFCETKIHERIAINVKGIIKSAFSKTKYIDMVPLFLMIDAVTESSPTRIDMNSLLFGPVIAEGASGVVSRAKYKGQDVAVKEFRAGNIYNLVEEERKVLLREIHILKNLVACKYIVSYFGSTPTWQPLCYIMEYISGGSLGKLLSSQKICERLKGKIAIDISEGMTFLHSKYIIHRDLKPDNVLICSTDYNADPLAKIADFDTARYYHQVDATQQYYSLKEFLAKSKSKSPERDNSNAVGTLEFQAPEILRGDSSLDLHACEAYSMSMVLWCIWTQQVPYTTGAYAKLEGIERSGIIREKVIKGERLNLPPNIHNVISQLITRNWNNDPSMRMTFADISKHLRDILKSLPTTIDGGTPSQQSSIQPKLPASVLPTHPIPQKVQYPTPPLSEWDYLGWCGDIDGDAAKSKLLPHPIGIFLTRWSHNKKSFVVSIRQRDRVLHVTDIYPMANGKISRTNPNGPADFDSLNTYVQDLMKEGTLSFSLNDYLKHKKN